MLDGVRACSENCLGSFAYVNNPVAANRLAWRNYTVGLRCAVAALATHSSFFVLRPP